MQREERINLILEDILHTTKWHAFLQQNSSEKHPDFFEKHKNKEINGYYISGLEHCFYAIGSTLINTLSSILSNGSDIASLKKVMKSLNRMDTEKTNLSDKSKSLLKALNKIKDHLMNENEHVKAIRNTRNNLTAHSYNETEFTQKGGGSRPSDYKTTINILLQWAIRLIAFCEENSITLKWDRVAFKGQIDQFETIASITTKYFFEYNSPRQGSIYIPIVEIPKDPAWDD